jgi:transposase
MALTRWVGRAIGLDVHRDFWVVAICEHGEVRAAGRVPSTPEGLGMLAQGLGRSDRVALEVTGSCWEVARILEGHVDRVVVVSPDDTGITRARAKTDRLDARTLARLLWTGELEAVWMPDERCRVLRRRLARREQLVHSRTRAKNEIHAVLPAPPAGQAAVLGSVRRQGPPGARHARAPRRGARVRRRRDPPDRVPRRRDRRGRAADRPAGARVAGDPPLDDRLRGEPDLRRNVHRRRRRPAPVVEQPQARRLPWPGPEVRQSGDAPARSGRISKRGSAGARWALVEAAWSVVLQPGPLHAFYDRTRARRGHGKAIVATARKLAILFWCMLTRGEDYAHQQPSLTKKKLRRLEITAGAPKYAKTARGIWSSNQAIRQAERQLAEQAEVSYTRLVTDQQAGAPARRVGASATPERA